MKIPVLAGEGMLCTALARDLECEWRELLAPLGIRFLDLGHARLALSLAGVRELHDRDVRRQHKRRTPERRSSGRDHEFTAIHQEIEATEGSTCPSLSRARDDQLVSARIGEGEDPGAPWHVGGL